MYKRTCWKWERTDPSRSGSSGDIAKLFRHEDPKNPGVFAEDPPSAAATLMAREVIQNSWDSARELQALSKAAPHFEMEFRFRRLRGTEKTALVESLDLKNLSDRIANLDRSHIGLRESDCLGSIADPAVPLQTLEIAESGAAGMHGSWDEAKSNMYRALVSIGYTEKSDGAGGSYGYGKAGLIAGSRVRSVVAYSCFNAMQDEPNITRRLLGMTYWGQHQLRGASYTGFARFGAADATDPQNIRPFENDSADSVASSMGMPVRSPIDQSMLGTTFLLIDPTVDPHELQRAIERAWWPALIEGDFIATIVDYDGAEHIPRPRRDRVLKTFIDAWEIASGRSEPVRDAEHIADIKPTSTELDAASLGRIGLVTDISGWSYADEAKGAEAPGVNHRSLVALTRSPRMVVEYYVAGQSPPYVRGAFVASEQVDDLLRHTEPKAHDAWRSKSEDGDLDPVAAATAEEILRKIRYQVNNHRSRIKPPVPTSEEIVLPAFNNVMRRIMSGGGPGISQPLPDERPLTIRLSYEPEAAQGGLIRVRGWVAFSLSEHIKEDEAQVDLSVIYRYLEEDRVGDAAELQFQLEGSSGFIRQPNNSFHGRLLRDEIVKITFVSEPYQPDWSGRLIVNGEVVEEDKRPKVSTA